MITNAIYSQVGDGLFQASIVNNGTNVDINTNENINLLIDIGSTTSSWCQQNCNSYTNFPHILNFSLKYYLVNNNSNDQVLLFNSFHNLLVSDITPWNQNGDINVSFPLSSCIQDGNYHLNVEIEKIVEFNCCEFVEQVGGGTFSDITFNSLNLETNQIETFVLDNYSVYASESNIQAVSSPLAYVNFTLYNILDLNITNTSFDYPNGLTITNPNTQLIDINGDDHIRVKGNVNINSNVNYTINNKTIEFLDKLVIDENNDDTYYSSGFIVNPKARLNLNNCIISSLEGCSTYMWEGIKVKGKYSSGNPGKLYLNNTELKNARTAVSVQRGSFNGISYYVSGFVSAVNSRFLNNHVSIKFSSPSNSPVSNSIINRCTFTCNNNLNDQVLYNSQGSYAFIQLNSSKGVQILGNTFNGNVNFNPSSRGIGILSYSSSYNVDRFFTNPQSGGLPNIFNNLTKGIDIYASGAATQTIKIKGNGFTNVQQSIKAEGAAFSEISMNSIIVPKSPDPQLPTWGIYLNKCIDYLTTENSIHYQESQNPSTYGIIVVSTTDANQSEIYKNTFTGKFAAGTQVEDDNSDLQIRCNTYSGEMGANWRVTTNSHLEPQGQCNNPDPLFPPAGNVFSPAIANSQNQIWNTANAFVYNSYSNQMPTALNTALVTVNDCDLSSNTNSCPSRINVYGSGNENGIIQMPPGQVKKALKANKLLELSNAGNIQAIINFLVAGNELQDLEILIPTYLDNGSCNHARAILNAMQRPNAEKENLFKFYSLLTDLCESGREEKDMTPIERDILQEVVNSNTRTSILAEGVEASISNFSIDRFPVTDEIVSSNRLVQNNTQTSLHDNSNSSPSDFLIYPNPNNGSAKISFENVVSGTIEIIDLTGKIYFQNEFKEQIEVKIESVHAGVYFLKYTDEKGRAITKKFIVKN